MKDVFPEFYRPSHEDLRQFVTGATIVLDTNVLLDLYRLGTSERGQVFDVLDKVANRLWLPYQVGLEYQRLRLGVVLSQAGAYETAKGLHGARSLKQMEEKLAGLHVPDEVRAEVQPLLSDLADKLRSAVASYETRIEELASKHVVTAARVKSEDPVRDRLDGLFAGRVGPKPDEKTHESRVKEGVRRIAAQIPPGYKDSSKENDERKAGDYLLWAQILDYAAGSDRPLLFITKDQKEDWFDRVAGDMIGPRVELVAEFAQRSEHGYHQVTLARFLTLANEFLSTSVDRTTIKRVSEPDRWTSRLFDVLSRASQPEVLEMLRRASQQPPIRPEVLEALRRASQQPPIRPEVLEALRRASQQPPIQPEVLEAMRKLAAHRYLEAVQDAQIAAEVLENVDEHSDDDENPPAMESG